MTPTALFHTIITLPEERIDSIRSGLRTGTKISRLFDFFLSLRESKKKFSNGDATEYVYGVESDKQKRRKTYLALMRVAEQLAKKVYAPTKTVISQADTEYAIYLTEYEKRFFMARDFARKGKWDEALALTTRNIAARAHQPGIDEFLQAQNAWIHSLALSQTKNRETSISDAEQDTLRDISTRAIIHALMMDVVAIQLQQQQYNKEKSGLHRFEHELLLLKDISVMKEYTDVVDFLASLPESGFSTMANPATLSEVQQKMLPAHQEMLKHNFSFLVTSTDENQIDNADEHYRQAFHAIATNNIPNAVASLHRFIHSIESGPELYTRYISTLLDCLLSLGQLHEARATVMQYVGKMKSHERKEDILYAHVLWARIDLHDADTIIGRSMFRTFQAFEPQCIDSPDHSIMLMRLKAKYFFRMGEEETLDALVQHTHRTSMSKISARLSYDFIRYLRAVNKYKNAPSTQQFQRAESIKEKVFTIIAQKNFTMMYLQKWIEQFADISVATSVQGKKKLKE